MATDPLPNEQEKKVLEAAEALMVETMKQFDPSHDVWHVQRVRRTALVLARSHPAKPDLLVVELAALLHDVLDKKYVSSSTAGDPYTYFLPFFTKLAESSPVHGKETRLDLVADGRASLIAKIVDNVSWTTEKKLRSQGKIEAWHKTCAELHCVQDADRLDAIGAFGILRCAAYTAATNKALHAPGVEAEKESAIQHFHDKLLHIRERLKTDLGRQLGEKRHQAMVSFLEAIDDEYNVRDATAIEI